MVVAPVKLLVPPVSAKVWPPFTVRAPEPVILPPNVSSAPFVTVRVLDPRSIVPAPVTFFRVSPSSSFSFAPLSMITTAAFSVAPPPSSSTVGAVEE